MSSFVGTIQQFVGTVAPWWLRNKYGGALLESAAAVLDNAGDALALGLAQGDPLRCDAVSLPHIARDRRLRLYATEGEASQRFRLSQWKPLHRQRGTHQGELRHIAPYFRAYPAIPTMRIVHQSGITGARATWHTLTGSDGIGPGAVGDFTMTARSPSNWNWDNLAVKKSRFWLIVYTSGLGFAASSLWDGGGTWDGGAIWDSMFNADQIADIAQMVVDWKAAHSRLAGIIFASDAASFDPAAAIVVNGDGTSTLPDGKWNYTIDPSTGLPTRLSTARYVVGVG